MFRLLAVFLALILASIPLGLRVAHAADSAGAALQGPLLERPLPQQPANVPVAATATCQGNDLIVTVTAGDGPFRVEVDSVPVTIITAYVGYPVGDFLFENPGPGPTVFGAVTVIEGGGDQQVLNLDPVACYDPVVATATCNGNDLVVAVTAGDGPFTVQVLSSPATEVTAYIGFPVGSFQFINTGPLATRFTSVTVTESGGDSQFLQLGPIVCGAVDVVATATCNGNDLTVAVTAGDPTFTVQALSTPQTTVVTYIGFSFGNFLFANPAGGVTRFSSVTVTEAGGDQQVLQLGPIVCPPPDLQISKSAAPVPPLSDYYQGEELLYTLTLTNTGGSEAVFQAGDRILVDDLPAGSATIDGVSGPAGLPTDCAVANGTLTCAATGPGQLDAGEELTVRVRFRPADAGALANPRAGGVCAVDPDGRVRESNEDNNTCATTVEVLPPHFTIRVTKELTSSSAPQGTPGAGWQFQLTGCGISRAATTDSSGLAVFSNVPKAASCQYQVTETVQTGWVALPGATQTVPRALPGTTVSLHFRNLLIEVCTTCAAPTSTTTPTPTATATTTPTATASPSPTTTTTPPASPTAEPTATATATPTGTGGVSPATPPASPTPRPPATGDTDGASGQGRAPLLLALAGVILLATGSTVLVSVRRR